MSAARRVLAFAILLLAVALAGCTSDGPSQAQQLREAAREATASLDTPQAALAAGYEPDPFCAPDEGVHWINEDLLDGEIEPAEPEALLFLPRGDDVAATDPGAQRFLGVEYLLAVEGPDEMQGDGLPADVMGVPLSDPVPGHTPGMPRHAELHVYLDERLAIEEPFPSRVREIDCPPATTPPGVDDEGAPSEAGSGAGSSSPDPSREEPASCRETLQPERTHEHARIEIYLESEEPFDLSPDRYQLADRAIHFEAGERDAGGAIVHLHQAGATLGCMLETLGWQVDNDRLVTDQGEAYEATDEHAFEVFVDGSRSPQGFDTPLEHQRSYVLRYDSSAPPTPCPDVDGGALHEHAQLIVRLNGSEPWNLSAPRYQDQAPFVRLEDGPEDAEVARIHVHEARPSLGCLFATLGWETSEHRIETDTGPVFEAGENATIAVLADGEPLAEGFDAPIQQARSYEVRYDANEPQNASTG